MGENISYWNTVDLMCPVKVSIDYYNTSRKTNIIIDNFEDFELFIEMMILFKTFIEQNPDCSMKLAYDIFKMINDNEDIPEIKEFALADNGMWRYISPFDNNEVFIAYRYENFERIDNLAKLLTNIFNDVKSGKITYA